MIKIFVFLFGSLVGSFLNVCIYRMPRDMSVNKPKRSFCPHCQKQVLWYDNVPFFSYLLLGGKCRFCRNPISFRYFLVEFITAAMLLVLYQFFGLSVHFFCLRSPGLRVDCLHVY
jgi:type 4 prepilin peptidase 1 (EC:3.4.23.43). Aspartic peptidase. MEROPS family A24A